MVTENSLEVFEVLPIEVWKALKTDTTSILVDVRTRAEWTYVGGPDLSQLGKQVVQIEWLRFSDRCVSPSFAQDLHTELGGQFPRLIFFLCRSGVRSLAAAKSVSEMAGQLGQTIACVNVLEGFEGDPDSNRHRGNTNGWKKRGLPWVQS